VGIEKQANSDLYKLFPIVAKHFMRLLLAGQTITTNSQKQSKQTSKKDTHFHERKRSILSNCFIIPSPVKVAYGCYTFSFSQRLETGDSPSKLLHSLSFLSQAL
jgi:hypothetical protein